MEIYKSSESVYVFSIAEKTNEKLLKIKHISGKYVEIKGQSEFNIKLGIGDIVKLDGNYDEPNSTFLIKRILKRNNENYQ